MTRDRQFIVWLLAGRTEPDERGLPRVTYLKEGSAKELEARRALAQMLRSSRPLDLSIRGCIADFIDPDRAELVDRQIRFEHRHRGKPLNELADLVVAEFIWAKAHAGVKIESAVAAAAECFGLKRSRILKIWSQWQPVLKLRTPEI